MILLPIINTILQAKSVQFAKWNFYFCYCMPTAKGALKQISLSISTCFILSMEAIALCAKEKLPII